MTTNNHWLRSNHAVDYAWRPFMLRKRQPQKTPVQIGMKIAIADDARPPKVILGTRKMSNESNKNRIS